MLKIILYLVLLYLLFKAVSHLLFGPPKKRRIFVNWGGGRVRNHPRDDDTPRHTPIDQIEEAEFEEIPDETPNKSSQKQT